MLFNFSIFLTWIRIAVIPIFIGVLYLPNEILITTHRNLVASLIFILAALTDWLDGFFSRKWKQISLFGEFLDPVADKLLITVALLMLVQLVRLDAVVATIFIVREIAILAIREWMTKIGESRNVTVNSLGRSKTMCQMIAIPMLLYDGSLTFGTITINTHIYGKLMIYIALILTILSILYYIKLALSKKK